MGRRTPPSLTRRILWAFLAVAAFTVAMLGWWVFYTVRGSARELDRVTAHYLRDQAAAQELIRAMARVGDPISQRPDALLEAIFPHLEWRAGVDPNQEIVPGQPGYGVAVRPERLTNARRKHDTQMRMFLAEGGTFVVVLMLGVALILRTLRREVKLMRQQSNFLSAVTHELKSPLASIRLYTETMLMREAPAERREHYLKNIQQDVDRLESLVGNVLAVARLEGGRFAVHIQPGDLGRDVSDLLRRWGDELAGRGLKIELNLPENEVPVRYDPAILQTVLRNLLDNAVKYGGESKQVQVRLVQDGRWARLEVADQGIGISADELKKVFQKFYRVGDELVRRTEGSGLGLYLVRQLARAVGGDVVAESPGLGKGSVFRVTFPIERQEAAA